MNRQRLRGRLSLNPSLFTNNFLVAVLVGLCVLFTVQSHAFFTFGNVKDILQNNAVLGIVSVSLTLLVISGGVDLSLGSNVGLSGLITSLAVTQWGMNGYEGILLGILTGAGVGSVNGFLCGVLRFNPVIVTLGMLGVVRGAALLIDYNQVFGLDRTLVHLGTGSFLGLPIVADVAIAGFCLGGVFLRFTTWGRQIYAIGSNREAAYLSALPVRALPFSLYVVSGLMSGVAGVMLAARLNGVSPGDQGVDLELQALTVVLLGGVAFAGGRGRLFGVFIGWLVLGVLNDGLILTNVSPFFETLIEGLALVIAAGLDAFGSFLAPLMRDRNKVALESEHVDLPTPSGSESGSQISEMVPSGLTAVEDVSGLNSTVLSTDQLRNLATVVGVELSDEDVEWLLPRFQAQRSLGQLVMSQPISGELPTEDPTWYPR